MTTCRQAHEFIELHTAGDALPPEDSRALEEHVASCRPCALRLRWQKRIQSELRHQAVPAPSADFESRVLAAAMGRKTDRSSGWRSGPVIGAAIAASFALGVFLTGGFDRSEPSSQVLADNEHSQPVTLAESGAAQDEPREQTVRLAFTAASELDDVSLTLELPANVELARFPGHRQLSWQVDLKAGENVIALPLRIIYPEAGELVAHLDDGARRKTFRTHIPGIDKPDQEPSP
ncbi:MAG: zf-HC2 domain-containing protein [Oleiphilaceae bacterium]|nr:zf-HC2 domain-containing protein [Oleiphilaceae bacterium]